MRRINKVRLAVCVALVAAGAALAADKIMKYTVTITNATATWTCPSGGSRKLTGVAFTHGEAVSGAVSLSITNPATAEPSVVYYSATLAANQSATWAPEQPVVVNSGEVLIVGSEAAIEGVECTAKIQTEM